ncbi:unnamed protein product, partial [Porites lobata]
KYGLFYFEIDKSTSILPNKKIKKVLSRGNNSKGSKVVVQFGSEDLEATITGVASKHPTNSLIIRLAYNRVPVLTVSENGESTRENQPPTTTKKKRKN